MGIVIFEKNKIDIDLDDVTITATDHLADDNGQEFVDFLRNRKNDSGWATTGSSDASNTMLEVMTGDLQNFSDLILIGHNLKSYTAEFWDGTEWNEFEPAIDVTDNAAEVTAHQFDEVMAYGIRLRARGTIVPDDDKFISQLVITSRLGEFVSQPVVKKPTISRGRKTRKMLSGRASVTRTLGAFSCSLVFNAHKNANDQALMELMYSSVSGFLVWLCGGNLTQMPLSVPGFRLGDVFLMSAVNEFDTEWRDGHFAHGQTAEIQLVESRS